MQKRKNDLLCTYVCQVSTFVLFFINTSLLFMLQFAIKDLHEWQGDFQRHCPRPPRKKHSKLPPSEFSVVFAWNPFGHDFPDAIETKVGNQSTTWKRPSCTWPPFFILPFEKKMKCHFMERCVVFHLSTPFGSRDGDDDDEEILMMMMMMTMMIMMIMMTLLLF